MASNRPNSTGLRYAVPVQQLEELQQLPTDPAVYVINLACSANDTSEPSKLTSAPHCTHLDYTCDVIQHSPAPAPVPFSVPFPAPNIPMMHTSAPLPPPSPFGYTCNFWSTGYPIVASYFRKVSVRSKHHHLSRPPTPRIYRPSKGDLAVVSVHTKHKKRFACAYIESCFVPRWRRSRRMQIGMRTTLLKMPGARLGVSEGMGREG